MNLAIIKKLVSLIGVSQFKDLLTKRIIHIFNISFNETNELNGFTTRTDPDAIKALEMREIILCDKSMGALHGDLKFELLEGIKNNESMKFFVKLISFISKNIANPHDWETNSKCLL